MENVIKPYYRVVEHSGDLAIIAWGADQLEALANASLSLVDQVVPLESISPVESVSFVIDEADEQTRAIALLNEIVYLTFVKRWLPCSVKHMTLCRSKGCSELQVILAGESADPARHIYKYDIKAVTYHEFKIECLADRVEIKFVCDL